MTDLKEQYIKRIAEVEHRISVSCERSNRDASEIKLIAVSKTKSAQEVDTMFAAGLTNFGENKAQELLVKSQSCSSGIEWHFIGSIQTNKLKKICTAASVIHSVDSIKQLEIISRSESSPEVLLQLSGDGDPTRGGVLKDKVLELYKYSQELKVNVNGVMIVPPADESPAQYFLEARDIARDLGLSHVSMGMSHDFETAIECGSTIIRVGSALFGART